MVFERCDKLLYPFHERLPSVPPFFNVRHGTVCYGLSRDGFIGMDKPDYCFLDKIASFSFIDEPEVGSIQLTSLLNGRPRVSCVCARALSALY